MRLRRLDLTRFGKFTNVTLDFGARPEGAPDLHLVYGLNEAGKSTAVAGFLDLLFGIEDRSRFDFLHPYATMEVGAALEFSGVSHELRRVKKKPGSLRDSAGQPISDGLLAGALGGLTREAYRSMFSLDDETLEQGGNAILESKGDLGELLFSASAGLAGLSKALTAVTGEADGIFRKRASSTEIAALKKKLEELKKARDQIDVQASAHSLLVAELDQKRRAYAEASTEHGTLKTLLNELTGLVRAAPLHAERERLRRELGAMGELPRPPSHWSSELPSLISDDSTLAAKLEGADIRIGRLKAECDAIAIEETLLRFSDRITALASSSVRTLDYEEDLPKRRAALAESRSRIAQFARSIAGDQDNGEPDALVVDTGTLGRLRGLIEKWSGIEAKVTSTTAEFDAATLALARAREEREILDHQQPVSDAAHKATLRAAVDGVRSSDLLPRHRLTTVAAQNRARDADEAFRLVPWLGDRDDLEKVRIPSPRLLQEWRDTLATQQSSREHHRQRLHDLTAEMAELLTRIATVENGAGAIGDEEAAVLRDRRDQAWTAHRDGPSTHSASAFEILMRAVDTMADARFAAADDLAELRGLRRDRDICRARMDRAKTRLAELDAEASALTARIKEALPGSTADMGAAASADQISAIEAWIGQRERAVAAFSAHRTALSELADADADIDEETSRLRASLYAVGLPAEGLELKALVQAADDLLAKEVSQTQARATADKLVREAERSLESRRKAAETVRREEQDWRDAWTRALALTWFRDHADDREGVRSIVDALGGLPALLAERDGLMHRVRSMEANVEAFRSSLDSLRRDLGEDREGEEAAAAATALVERHRLALNADAQRKKKTEELIRTEEERVVICAELAIHDARKADLLGFFDLADLKKVSARLDLCARRDRLEEECDKLASRILQETGSSSLEAAEERLAETDPTERAQEHEECSRRVEDLGEKLKALFAARSAAEDKLAAIGGDDAVARIEAKRRTVMLEIEDKAIRYLHLRTGAILAERAIRIYREKHRGSMMSRASEAFKVITRNGYSGLATQLEKDRETLIGVSGAGGSKLATNMSKGTRFQLYLALRLAGYAEFATTRQPVPFIADDIMETFDEPRSEEVLSLFGGMSETGQVIYLTHHRHLCDLARKVVPGVVIHELPS